MLNLLSCDKCWGQNSLSAPVHIHWNVIAFLTGIALLIWLMTKPAFWWSVYFILIAMPCLMLFYSILLAVGMLSPFFPIRDKNGQTFWESDSASVEALKDIWKERFKLWNK